MTPENRLWLLRYAVESKRRSAFEYRNYFREAFWAITLALLSLGSKP